MSLYSTRGGENMAEENFDQLVEFAKGGGGQFIKFDDSMTSIEGLYLGYNLEDDSFNPGEKKAVYHFEINQDKKSLSSSSKRLARAIVAARPTPGCFIKVTRIPGSSQYDTKFEVQVSDTPF